MVRFHRASANSGCQTGARRKSLGAMTSAIRRRGRGAAPETGAASRVKLDGQKQLGGDGVAVARPLKI